ncbi:protein kinase [Streptomyces sp. NPDC051217]|uniref:serine/threonine-protein kinase n=1 Tax=Streptomyces sp. NPDC051217 TaxID=3365644 RepID=UPI003797EA01
MPTHDEDDAASSDTGAGRLVAGRYRLLAVLGYGGMGTVWRAHDEVLQREVAVKEVRAPVGLSAERVERMYTRMHREAWAAARISARGVVTVHDVATDEGRPWIVMEFIRGQSLADVINSTGALPPREVARVGSEVLAALRGAHDAGVLHRDVKPANVLLADDGRVVLTDFGIAAVEGESALTMTGEVVGSPEYLAPERALGRAPGPASDLWSLGILLYTAVQGRSPFRRTTALSTMRAVVDDQLPQPHKAGPLASVIEGLTRKDPAERMSAEEAERELGFFPADTTAPSAPTSGTASLPTAELPLGESEPTAATEELNATATSPAPRHTADPRVMVAMIDTSTKEEPRTPTVSEADAAAPHSSVPGTGRTAAAAVPTAGELPPASRSDAPLAAGQPATPPIPVDRNGEPRTSPLHPSPRATSERADASPHASAGIASSPTGAAGPASTSVPTAVPAGPVSAATDQVGAGTSSSGSTPRRRRTGLITVAGVALVLLAGSLGYALMDRESADRTNSGSLAGQEQDDSGAAAGKPDATAEKPVSITVTGDATDYAGSCPPSDSQAPRFTANFTVSELPIQFSYRWVSANGSVIDRRWRTLEFREGGPRSREETVSLSAYAGAGTLRSELAVEIRSPFDAVSNSVPFSITCGSVTSS